MRKRNLKLIKIRLLLKTIKKILVDNQLYSLQMIFQVKNQLQIQISYQRDSYMGINNLRYLKGIQRSIKMKINHKLNRNKNLKIAILKIYSYKKMREIKIKSNIKLRSLNFKNKDSKNKK